METRLADFIRDTPDGREADAILRACVHCGFCTATCPTYQLLGDELDGPRGRIYLMKQMLEGSQVSESTQLHLDRCLTCRACETACPSGVRYGRLVDIGRHWVDSKVGRRGGAGLKRWLLRKALSRRVVFAAGLKTGRLLRPLLPRALAAKVPPLLPAKAWPPRRHDRKMLVLEGCVQGAIAPGIDASLARVLDRIDISLINVGGGCCGAVAEHLGGHHEAQRQARRNIDAWWPHIEGGAEAIVVTASGCGVLVKDYAWLLRDDPAYADKARRVAALARDPVEVIAAEWKRFAPLVAMDHGPLKIAFQAPCTLQHGQKLGGRVEEILEAIGLELTDVAGAHLCCGSAGTYSILQPELSGRLKANKITALEAGDPEIIATANIGCLAHLQSATERPVRHWIELFDARLRSRASARQSSR
ncbi:MAG TPA: glycolate oxidase subunit GlcF [Casimicrobiaceae bacterium]|nr:glycolate oxidase subunit GlcF [Casimicrobiaceae bacterium]